MPELMPVLFIGHGSPMNVVLDNSFTRSLAAWGQRLPRPRAIMVISAHWLTEGTYVGCMDRPKTIHDFYGFPDELYRKRYPCPGSAADAREAAQLARTAGARCDADWGLDHGAWSVLLHLFPKADIPVFQFSLDYRFNDWHAKPPQYHYDLGKELADLRGKGVLIIGSGNIAHNLGMIDFDMDAPAMDWARTFDEAVKDALQVRDDRKLISLASDGPAAGLAVPTQDHYLPLLYAIALRKKNEPLSFTYEGFQHGSISMRCFQIG